jgi:hypothetical protein
MNFKRNWLFAVAFILIVLLFSLVWLLSASLEDRINSILEEYVAEFFKQKVEPGDKGMESFAQRIISLNDEIAPVLAEIMRKDGKDLTGMIEKVTTKSGRLVPDPEECARLVSSEKVTRLNMRMALSSVALKKLGSPGVHAFVSLLKEIGLAGRFAAIMLGQSGEKETLLKHFRDDMLTDAERANSALGLTMFFKETEPLSYLIEIVSRDVSTDSREFLIATIAKEALRAVPEETINVLRELISQGKIPKKSFTLFEFLDDYGFCAYDEIFLGYPNR